MSLQGKRIIVSRAKEQAGSLSSLLQEQGADVLEIPFIEIRPAQSYEALDKAIENLMAYDWLILTSVNGVKALFHRLELQGKSEADLLHLKVVAIGPATRKAIEKHGIPVDVMPNEYVAEAVVEEMRSEMVRGERVLLVRAKVARDVIPNALRDLGAKVHVMEAYETVVPESSRTSIMEALQNGPKPWAITFTSSSTVKNFVELLGEENAHSNLLDGVNFASIGPVTSSTLKHEGLRVDVEAKEYTIPGLVDAMVKAAK